MSKKQINTLTFNETTYNLIFKTETSSAGRDLAVTNYYYNIYKNGIKLPYEVCLYNSWDIEDNNKTFGITIENDIHILFANNDLNSLEIDMDLMLWIVKCIEELEK